MNLGFVFLAAMGIIEVLAITLGQASFAISQACEDGSFYVQVAQNIALGYGPTFDQIAPTNATHWGWLFVLAGVFKAMPQAWILDPDTLFRISGVTYFLLLLGAGFVVAIRQPFAAVFMVAYLANRGYWYMEDRFVLLTLAVAICWPRALTGFVLTFARTDMVLFALFSRQWRLAAGAICGFLGVCLLNIVIDGTPISVSAQIKSAGWNDWDTIIQNGHRLALHYPILPLMCLLALFSADCWFLASLGLLILHALHNSEPEGWYLAPTFLTSLLCADRVVRYYGCKLWDEWGLVGLPRVRRRYKAEREA